MAGQVPEEVIPATDGGEVRVLLCRDAHSMKIPAGGGLTAHRHTRPSFLPNPICAPNVVGPFMRAAGRPHELLELAAVPPNLILCHDHEIGHVAVEVEQLQGRGGGGGGGRRDARWNRSQRSRDRVQARGPPHPVLADGAQKEPAKLRQRPAGLDPDALTVGELDRRVTRLAPQLVRLRR